MFPQPWQGTLHITPGSAGLGGMEAQGGQRWGVAVSQPLIPNGRCLSVSRAGSVSP